MSHEAMDLVHKLLTPKPAMRLSAAQALDHPWFYKMLKKKDQEKQEDLGSHGLDKQVVNALRGFQGVSKLKKAAMNVLINMVEPS